MGEHKNTLGPGSSFGEAETFTEGSLDGSGVPFSNSSRCFPVVPGYDILKNLGEGGMGTVYLARQQQPRRMVALKTLRGHFGNDARRRFEAESNVLAMMNHNNVAKVFETRTTKSGQAFFSMEYINGKTLSHFFETHELKLKECLGLFLQICNGVSHAHHKTVLHRDLKPQNIMVVEELGKPLVKVIDFGLARITEDANRLNPVETRAGALMGTPGYMSPEQLDGATGLDVRTDVYALGIILYEILVGRHPLDLELVKDKPLLESLRFFRETEIPRPSDGLRKMLAEQGTSSGKRRVAALQGDLDSIVLKAVQKNADARYVTVDAFIRDIHAYLNHWPVRARPRSRFYQIGRFIERHKVFAITTLLVLMSICFGLWRNHQSLIVAQRALAQEKTSKERVGKALRLVGDTLASSDPRRLGADARVIDLLRDIEQKAHTQKDPVMSSFLHYILGRSHFGFAKYQSAHDYLAKAYLIADEQFGEAASHTLDCRRWLAHCLQRLADPSHIQHFEAIYQLRKIHQGEEALPTLSAKAEWAYYIFMSGKDREKAIEMVQHAVESFEKQGSDDYQEALGLNLTRLGVFYRKMGQDARAEPYYARALAVQRATLSPGHPELLATHGNYGALLHDLGRYEQAVEILKGVVARGPSVRGPNHPSDINNRYFLTLSLLKLDRIEEADYHAGLVFEGYTVLGLKNFCLEAGIIMFEIALLRQDVRCLERCREEAGQLWRLAEEAAKDNQTFVESQAEKLGGLLLESRLFLSAQKTPARTLEP